MVMGVGLRVVVENHVCSHLGLYLCNPLHIIWCAQYCFSNHFPSRGLTQPAVHSLHIFSRPHYMGQGWIHSEAVVSCNVVVEGVSTLQVEVGWKPGKQCSRINYLPVADMITCVTGTSDD